jgi:hypothetical protein
MIIYLKNRELLGKDWENEITIFFITFSVA